MSAPAPLRVFSFGGGWQSVAALVLAARGEIDYPVFLFANVGNDSENPGTLEYLTEHAGPFAQRHGIQLYELERVLRAGARKGHRETVLERADQTPPRNASVGIPMRQSAGEQAGKPLNRNCTVDFKIRVIAHWTKEHGATVEQPAAVGIGFSVDEWQRVGPRLDNEAPHQFKEYPLIERRISRAQCGEIIKSAGLPLPPKSACWFCPFHSLQEWARMAQENPAMFERACALEDRINARRARLGAGDNAAPVYMSDAMMPLRQVFAGGVPLTLPGLDAQMGCDTGYCMR